MLEFFYMAKPKPKSAKTSSNVKETQALAEEFAALICETGSGKGACVVGLSGDLGAGKTAFTQAAGKALGIKRRMQSPTFVLMRRYPLKGKFKNLFHLDAYRLKNEAELLKLGWQELISNPEHLVFIEWPENVKKIMPKKHHSIKIAHQKNGGRVFKINYAKK